MVFQFYFLLLFLFFFFLGSSNARSAGPSAPPTARSIVDTSRLHDLLVLGPLGTLGGIAGKARVEWMVHGMIPQLGREAATAREGQEQSLRVDQRPMEDPS